MIAIIPFLGGLFSSLLGGAGAGALGTAATAAGAGATGGALTGLGALKGAGTLAKLGSMAQGAQKLGKTAAALQGLFPKGANIGGGIGGARAGLGQITAAAAPGMAARQQALQQYQDITSGATDITQDPGYQAGLEQQQRSLESSAAARGMQLSGMNVEDIAGLGSQYYQQQRRGRLGELAQLAGITQPEFAAGTGAMGDIAGLPLQQMALNIAQRQGQAKTRAGTIAGLGQLAQAGGAQGIQELYGMGEPAGGYVDQTGDVSGMLPKNNMFSDFLD